MPDTYGNMKTMFFDKYSSDIAELSDSQLLMVSNVSNGVRAAKILPSAAPPVSNALVVEWTPQEVAAAGALSGAAGELSVLVCNDASQVVGVAMYAHKVLLEERGGRRGGQTPSRATKYHARSSCTGGCAECTTRARLRGRDRQSRARATP